MTPLPARPVYTGPTPCVNEPLLEGLWSVSDVHSEGRLTNDVITLRDSWAPSSHVITESYGPPTATSLLPSAARFWNRAVQKLSWSRWKLLPLTFSGSFGGTLQVPSPKAPPPKAPPPKAPPPKAPPLKAPPPKAPPPKAPPPKAPPFKAPPPKAPPPKAPPELLKSQSEKSECEEGEPSRPLIPMAVHRPTVKGNRIDSLLSCSIPIVPALVHRHAPTVKHFIVGTSVHQDGPRHPAVCARGEHAKRSQWSMVPPAVIDPQHSGNVQSCGVSSRSPSGTGWTGRAPPHRFSSLQLCRSGGDIEQLSCPALSSCRCWSFLDQQDRPQRPCLGAEVSTWDKRSSSKHHHKCPLTLKPKCERSSASKSHCDQEVSVLGLGLRPRVTGTLPSPYSTLTAPRRPQRCSSDSSSVLSGDLPPAMGRSTLFHSSSSSYILRRRSQATGRPAHRSLRRRTHGPGEVYEAEQLRPFSLRETLQAV